MKRISWLAALLALAHAMAALGQEGGPKVSTYRLDGAFCTINSSTGALVRSWPTSYTWTLYDSTSNQFYDWSDDTWKASPTTKEGGTVTESPASSGMWYIDFTTTTWGTRTVDFILTVIVGGTGYVYQNYYSISVHHMDGWRDVQFASGVSVTASVPAGVAAGYCRVYTYFPELPATTPTVTVSYLDTYHTTNQTIQLAPSPTYSSVTGLWYVDVAQGARVGINGISRGLHKVFDVPALSTVALDGLKDLD